MLHAPRATLDVRVRCETYRSSLHKQVKTGAPKNTVPTNIAQTRIARTTTTLMSIIPMSIDPTTREREITNLHRMQGIELSFRRVPRTCWMN